MSLQAYTLYNPNTKRILGTGYSKDPNVEPDAGQAVVLGIYDPEVYQINNGVAEPLVRSTTEATAIVAHTRTHAKYLVNLEIGQERAKYITVIPGQDGVYKQKQTEAQLYMANNSVADVEIPHIVREVGITGPDKAAVAGVILGLADFWINKSAAFEEVRLEYRALLDAAATVSEIDTIMGNFRTALSTA